MDDGVERATASLSPPCDLSAVFLFGVHHPCTGSFIGLPLIQVGLSTLSLMPSQSWRKEEERFLVYATCLSLIEASQPIRAPQPPSGPANHYNHVWTSRRAATLSTLRFARPSADLTLRVARRKAQAAQVSPRPQRRPSWPPRLPRPPANWRTSSSSQPLTLALLSHPRRAPKKDKAADLDDVRLSLALARSSLFVDEVRCFLQSDCSL